MAVAVHPHSITIDLTRDKPTTKSTTRADTPCRNPSCTSRNIPFKAMRCNPSYPFPRVQPLRQKPDKAVRGGGDRTTVKKGGFHPVMSRPWDPPQPRYSPKGLPVVSQTRHRLCRCSSSCSKQRLLHLSSNSHLNALSSNSLLGELAISSSQLDLPLDNQLLKRLGNRLLKFLDSLR